MTSRSLKIKGVFFFFYHQVFFILLYFICVFLGPFILLAIRFNLIVLLGFFVFFVC